MVRLTGRSFLEDPRFREVPFTRAPIVLKPFKKKRSALSRIITSPQTTLILGATLATLLSGGAAAGLLARGITRGIPKATLAVGKAVVPKTPRGIILTTAGVGALTTSPTLRSLLDPRKIFQRGREVGRIVEDPSKLIPKEQTARGIKEKVVDIFKEAGPAAAVGAALAGGAVVAAKKVKSLIPGLPGAPGKPTAESFSVLPTQVSPTIAEPLGPAKKPEPEKPLEEIKPVAVMPTIKNIFKPSIDIRFSKKRTFINQQLLIR